MARSKNKATLDTLAHMVAKGFESIATKEDLKELATKKELLGVEYRLTEKIDSVDQKVNKVDNRVDEVYEILARFEEGDILDLQKRVKILERTVKALSRQFS
ncbi:MAG: hypothetical protein AAB792_02900 [Patescibacteria group bacterium]